MMITTITTTTTTIIIMIIIIIIYYYYYNDDDDDEDNNNNNYNYYYYFGQAITNVCVDLHKEINKKRLIGWKKTATAINRKKQSKQLLGNRTSS